MAKLEFCGKIYRDEQEIRDIMAAHGVIYERWGIRAASAETDERILDFYKEEVGRLKRERHYLTADLVSLRPDTPGLAAIGAKFDQEHHHSDDEVRFTVEGEGVFEINTAGAERLKFTAEAGDLIVIPAKRRHLFYLTPKQTIRAIRLFKTAAGWEAIYQREEA